MALWFPVWVVYRSITRCIIRQGHVYHNFCTKNSAIHNLAVVLSVIFLNGMQTSSMNTNQKVKAAHGHSSNHRAELMRSKICGCFYCGNIFSPTDIDHWIDKNHSGIGQTATCPKCSVDSILGDDSGYPITTRFLELMHGHWFNG